MNPSRKLNIGYDASASLGAPGGIARYTLELLRALVALDDPGVHFTVLLNSFRQGPREEHDFLFRSKNVTVVRRRIPGPLLIKAWQRHGWPAWESVAGSADVVHAPASYIPPTKAPVVVTVHDLCFLRDSERAALGAGHFAASFPKQLPGVAAIVTPSRFVAAEVQSIYGIDAAKVHAIHSGLDAEVFRPDGTVNRYYADLHFNGEERFLLGIASTAPRKRLGILEELARRGLPVMILGLPERAFAGTGIVYIPKLKDSELAEVYRGAMATLFPTREEGFGFPVLESLACGTPILCGRHSALTELGEGWATWVDGDDIGVWEAAARTALAADVPPEWSAAASAHANSFTWERTARQVLAVYRDVAAKK